MTELASLPPQAREENDAPVPSAFGRSVVLKEGDTFLVANASGDVLAPDEGLFHNDTRLLSRLVLRLGGTAPCLLSGTVSHDNVYFTANLTNAPLPAIGEDATADHVIHIERQRLLWENRIFERLRVRTYGGRAAVLPVSLSFAADFRDMFEVRGQHRPARGERAAPEIGERAVVFRYEGLDRVPRASCLSFSEKPKTLDAGQACWDLAVPQSGVTELYLEVGPAELAGPAGVPSRRRYRTAAAHARMVARRKRLRSARLFTPNSLFEEWIGRSQADLALLTTELPTGPYPYAGIPWFSTPFGRDAIITSLQVLWLDPSLAKGVLAFLAAHQAKDVSAFQDSQPGKIMHETRKGEMTALHELPFGLYYGGVDTTPLFVVLAGAYADRTGDLAFIETLWPALNAAARWVVDYGDSDGDGFVDYQRGAESGLKNQGWKDSQDSIFHADGRFPTGAVALVEVQGYAYAAFLAMGALAERLGHEEEGAAWRERAVRLRQAVEARFWIEEEGFYGIALDGDGSLCRVLASNAGHLLFTGLAEPGRGARVAERLMSRPFNPGWGIRTLAEGQARFNPMSYHNGSVWPHDTGLCAMGMAKYGARGLALSVLEQVFEAAARFSMRLPELFCGFERAAAEPPIPYPVACLPQAWAAGSVFMLLQAALGISIDGWNGEISIAQPMLPSGVDRLSLKRLRVGDKVIDITFRRAGARVIAYADAADGLEMPLRIRL